MYENVTYEEILKRMLSRVPDKLDKREGSVIWDALSPAAIELQILYIELDAILREAYGDTASREFLVLRCRERGITPHKATKAVLKGVFVPSGLEMSGKRFNIGEINYTVTEKIAEGEYQVECETEGNVGNLYFGIMTPMDYIKGLQTAELTEILIPGEDEENTEDLRKRYFASFDEKSFGGNVEDYIEKTNAIAGVGKTKVTRVWNRDISPAAMVPSEAVRNWYQSVMEGEPEKEVDDWLRMVFTAAAEKKLTTGGTVLLTIIDSAYNTASDTLIKTVQNAIDPEENAGDGYGLAPIGHVVTVKSVNAVSINIETTVTFDLGYGWDNLRNPIENAISDYLLELRKEWADMPYLIVRISQIETRILGIAGVVDVQGTLINGQGENCILGAYDIPVFGGVNLWQQER